MIDVHHHMFPARLTDALLRAGVDRIGGEPVVNDWSPERSLVLMDRYGIDAAILSVPVPLQFADARPRRLLARELNEFGHETTRRFPGRFGFFATLPLPDVEAGVAEARYALDRLGADGVTMLTNHASVYQGDPRLAPIYAELDARQAVCFVHPTVPTGLHMPTGNTGSPIPALQPSLLEFPFDTTRAVASLLVSRTLDRFPRIRFVFTHCGGCVSSLANRLIDRHPIVSAYAAGHPSLGHIESLLGDAQRDAREHLGKLYYDVALSSDTNALSSLLGLVSPRRLLLGTDFPMAQEIGAHLTLRGLDEFSRLTAEDRARVRSETAADLFRRFASTSCRRVA
jgi:predicted TIM-barrel fold metal-dependent hydrolase